MIHPSYVDLMKVVNAGVEEGETPVINSRYSIVMATAKRARQIVDGDEPLTDNIKCNKALSIAVQELNESKIRILTDEEAEKAEEEELERRKEAQVRSEQGGMILDGLDDEDEDSESGEESEDDEEDSEDEEEEESEGSEKSDFDEEN